MHRKKMVAVEMGKGNRLMCRSVSVVPLALLIAVFGCYVKWDLRQMPSTASPNAYEVDAIYELLQDVFVVAPTLEVKDKTGCLTPPGEIRAGPAINAAPPTIADWEKHFMTTNELRGKIAHSSSMPCIKHYGTHAVGVARRGVHLKFLYSNQMCSFSWWYGYSCYDTPIAVIQDGEYAGWMVDIADISVWYPQKHMDSRFLRKLERNRDFVGNGNSQQK